MRQTKKGKQWHFGMKAHIGVDSDSGLVHTVTARAANAPDVTEVGKLLHGHEQAIDADAGYTGAPTRPEVSGVSAVWRIAARRSALAQLTEGDYKDAVQHYEHLKARMRARVEHPFRVIKRPFGYRMVRYRGLAKNAAQVLTLFALSNLWMKRRTLLAMAGSVRPTGGKNPENRPRTAKHRPNIGSPSGNVGRYPTIRHPAGWAVAPAV